MAAALLPRAFGQCHAGASGTVPPSTPLSIKLRQCRCLRAAATAAYAGLRPISSANNARGSPP